MRRGGYRLCGAVQSLIANQLLKPYSKGSIQVRALRTIPHREGQMTGQIYIILLSFRTLLRFFFLFSLSIYTIKSRGMKYPSCSASLR